jgi:Tfp pilus assembly protein FimT
MSKLQRTSQAGFTLTELVVSIAIMIFIMALILVNYAKFDSGIVLTNLAYDVGLSVRKAQTYGISVQGKNTGVTLNFTYPYGIHFDINSPQSYLIFADMNNNGQYDVAGNEKVEGYMLRSPYRIQKLCTGSCTSTLTTIDILFQRPNPDARIYANTVQTNEAAEIHLYSAQDTASTRKILVRTTGQISIK